MDRRARVVLGLVLGPVLLLVLALGLIGGVEDKTAGKPGRADQKAECERTDEIGLEQAHEATRSENDSGMMPQAAMRQRALAFGEWIRKILFLFA